MKFQIAHHTTYNYSAPVMLQAHTVRLRPRSDAWQSLHAFSLEVEPTPAGTSHVIDLDGNVVTRLWFHQHPVQQLAVKTTADVETHCTNPFNYLLEPWATTLPLNYPLSLATQLHPYLYYSSVGYRSLLDPISIQLGQELWHFSEGHVGSFLAELNQRIYKTCGHIVRETGAPLPPSITWNQRLGSCRDLVALFMEVCRSVGLATRFVSGYHEVEPDCVAHLHAWAEVYLPGAGWRGYDPTQGLAVCDRHIALAASAHPQQTAPIHGTFLGTATQTSMHYDLRVTTMSSPSTVLSD